MKISYGMIRSYLSRFLYNALQDQGSETPPVDLAVCDDAIEIMREGSESHGDLPYIKLALEILLGDQSSDLANTRFGNPGEGCFSKEERYRVFGYAYRKMFPDAPFPPKPPTDIEMIDVDHESWVRVRESQKEALEERLATEQR